MNVHQFVRSVWITVVASLIVVICVGPLIYMTATSLKTGSAVFEPTFMPAHPSTSNYRALFLGAQPFGRQIINSLMVSTLTVFGSTLLAITASYALGRCNFRGKGLLMMTMLGVSMFPQVAILSGMFELMQALGLYNHALGLVVPYTVFTLPFTIWLLTSFMKQMPMDLEEAAIMDGCGPLGIVFKIFLPLLLPALVSTALLAFIGAWNELLFALTFIAEDSERTVPVGITMISGDTAFEIPWGSLMAASTLVTVPLLMLVLYFQRHIVSGLTAGAIKG
jgi:trehalose/maltose transport system permease protein